MRVNMVPRDGGNQFHGQFFGNFAGENFASDNCGSAGTGSALHAIEPDRQHDIQPQQHADQRRRSPEDLGRQPVDRRSDQARQAVVPLHVPALGRREDEGRQLLRSEPVAVHLRRRHRPARHRRRPHRQQRRCACRGRRRGKDKISVYHDDQREVSQPLGHRRDDSAGGAGDSGDADQLRQRDEVDADAHQPAAARSRLRHLQPGVHRALSAERDRSRGQGVGPRCDSQLDASTPCSISRTTGPPTRGRTRRITSRCCARSWARPRT